MTTVTSLDPAKNWTRYGNIDVNPLHPSGVSKVSQLGNGYSKGSEARILPFPNNGQVWRYSYGCCIEKIVFLNNVVLPKTSFGPPQVRSLNLPLSLWGYTVQCFGDVALSCGQGVDITIPVTCSVFEPDPMTSQCTRGVPRLKFGHKIHEMWVFFSFVAIASQKFYRRVAKHHCCFISHMVPPLEPMTSPVKVIWPDGHTCIKGPWAVVILATSILERFHDIFSSWEILIQRFQLEIDKINQANLI